MEHPNGITSRLSIISRILYYGMAINVFNGIPMVNELNKLLVTM